MRRNQYFSVYTYKEVNKWRCAYEITSQRQCDSSHRLSMEKSGAQCTAHPTLRERQKKVRRSCPLATFRFWRTMANGSTIASHVIQNAMASTPYWENNGLERYSPDTRAVIAAESRFTYANFSRNGRRFLRQRDSVTNTERVK